MKFQPLKLPQILSRLEKVTILFLLVFILCGTIFILRQNYLKTTRLLPDHGGIYTEGVLQSSAASLSDSISNLTHIGLTRLAADGSIDPAVAKSWQTSPDGKVYTFYLGKGYSATKILEFFKDQKGSWSDIAITAPTQNTLVFTLKKPYGLFLASTLKPILPYGPFKIDKETANQITLIKNTNSPFSDPYIDKVIFKIYPTLNQLKNDLKAGKITSTDENIGQPLKGDHQYSVNIPRYNVAFLNIEKNPDKNIRSQIINGPAFPSPKNLILLRANTDSAKKFTLELTKKLHKNNIQIAEKVYPSIEILTTQAAQKQYDILIDGFNTGYYNDPYPYWHTSQIPPNGMNFALYKNKTADRLMEEARLTLDPKIRQDKFNQIKAIIDGDAVALYQKSEPYQFLVSKSVKGIDFKFVVTPTNRFSFLDKWYIKTKRVSK